MKGKDIMRERAEKKKEERGSQIIMVIALFRSAVTKQCLWRHETAYRGLRSYPYIWRAALPCPQSELKFDTRTRLSQPSRWAAKVDLCIYTDVFRSRKFRREVHDTQMDLLMVQCDIYFWGINLALGSVAKYERKWDRGKKKKTYEDAVIVNDLLWCLYTTFFNIVREGRKG